MQVHSYGLRVKHLDGSEDVLLCAKPKAEIPLVRNATVDDECECDK